MAALWCFTTETKGKQFSPWYKYPKRMLQMRARSWALRDTFADILAGFSTVEEARDIHQQYDTVIDATSAEVIKEVDVPTEKQFSQQQKLEGEVELRCKDKDLRNGSVASYLKVISETTGRGAEEVAARAMSNFEPFLKSYLQWNINED